MSELWSLSGYDVRSLVGDGRAGDLWSAVDRATGEQVVLRRMGGALDVGRLQALVELHAALPYVVRLREVVAADGLWVLVLDAPQGGSLDALLARRGALSPGEVVTVGLPVAEALAAGHAAGLVHGGLDASSVLFTAEGMPVLDGLGLEEHDETPQEDVTALAELCAGLLAPGSAPALEAVLAQASALDASLTADELAGRLRRACEPAPVRLRPGAGWGPEPVSDPAFVARHARRRWRPTSGSVVGVGLVLLVLGGAGAGWWSGRGGEQPAPVRAAAAADTGEAVETGEAAAAGGAGEAAEAGGAGGAGEATEVPGPADTAEAGEAGTAAGAADGRWAPVLEGLFAARARAFAAADEAALAGVYAPSSPGGAADARLVRALAAAGRTAEGVRHRVLAVEVVAVTADAAELRVVDSLAAYDVRDADGTVVARRPGRGEAAQRVRLSRTDAGWRLVDVAPA